MKPEVIICLVCIVGIIEVCHRTILAKGFRFCKLTDDFDELMRKIEEIRNNEEIRTVEQAVYTDSFMFIYSPNDREKYFYQFEVLISEIENCYKWIKNWEVLFQNEDWFDIQKRKQRYAELVNKVRMEEWHN